MIDWDEARRTNLARRYQDCDGTCTTDCGHCKGNVVEVVAYLRAELAAVREFEEHYRQMSHERGRFVPVVIAAEAYAKARYTDAAGKAGDDLVFAVDALSRSHDAEQSASDRLYGKFHVKRADGRDQPGGDKADARYFVLDYVHDPAARTALRAYADASEQTAPRLAADLRAAVDALDREAANGQC